MNLRQPFEQLIAGKLRQLPTPDAETSWQQMKRLLDDDDNRGGGGNPPPGNSSWWRMGIIAIVLLTGTWLFVEKSGKTSLAASKNNMSASPQPGTGSTANNSVNKQSATIDNNTTLPVTTQTTNTAINEAAASNANTVPGNSGKSAMAAVTAANNTVTPEKNTETASAGNAVTAGTSNKNNAGTAPVIKSTAAKNSSNKSTVANSHSPLIKIDGAATESNAAAAENHLNNNKKNKMALASLSVPGNKLNKTRLPAAGLTGVDKNSTAAADVAAQNKIASSSKKSHSIKHVPGKFTGNAVHGRNNSLPLQDDKNGYASSTFSGLAYTTTSGRQKTWFERLTGLKADQPLPSFDAALAAGDSMSSERPTGHLLNAETKKAVAKAQRDKAFEAADRKERKQFHLNLGNLFKPFSLRVDTDPWWAAGLSLNSGVTLNTQNRFNYNVNAKSSTLSDYIPSPYLQFHLNNYVYVQTELNLIAPQYTPQLLIYRKSNEITAQAGMSQQKSIYIQKMYYFNWPLSLHYSPISNFYFSGGIQFSSFQSGLASIEQKEYTTALGADHPSNTYTTTLKFKDDSIASKIAPNEWRWQLGAEYYWNRFSVGLRYNQSFKNAINATVSPLLPHTVSRNESMFLFIKYNLFESRRQNTVPKNQ